MPDTGKDKAYIIIYFGRGRHSGARVPGGHLLLYCYGGRYALDGIHIWRAHPPEELAGIRRQTFREPSLALGIEGIKDERRLAGAGNSSHHYELPVRNLQSQIFEVIDSGTLDYDVFFHDDSYSLESSSSAAGFEPD